MENIIIFGAKYLIIFLVAIAFVFFLKLPREKQKEMAFFAIITLPIIYLLAKISSLFYFDPRPFVVGPPAGGFTPLIAHANDNGFPSDHTLLSSAVAVIVFYYNKKVGATLLFLGLLVGTARVLAGVHHGIDIAGSIVIAIVVSFLVHRFVLPMILKSGFYKKLK